MNYTLGKLSAQCSESQCIGSYILIAVHSLQNWEISITDRQRKEAQRDYMIIYINHIVICAFGIIQREGILKSV